MVLLMMVLPVTMALLTVVTVLAMVALTMAIPRPL
jgi:hypothetical protein